jgi:CubicO group peptidase (beta-lactamase class C family)
MLQNPATQKLETALTLFHLSKIRNYYFNPGDSVYCSEGGMVILGAIIKKVSGISYKDYVLSR